MNFDLQRSSAFVALAIVVAGYLLVFRPLEATVGERYADLDAARLTLEQRRALARRIPELEREQRQLATQLGRVHVGDRRAETVDRFLQTVAGVSARDAVAVESVSAAIAQQPRATPPAVLEEVPLDVTLRGRYADVIRAARDLNAADAAAGVTLASLGNAGRRPGTQPQLNAALHVTLLREPDDATAHAPHAL